MRKSYIDIVTRNLYKTGWFTNKFFFVLFETFFDDFFGLFIYGSILFLVPRTLSMN